MANITPTALSVAAGISVPYASQIIGGIRTPSRKVAIRIYRTVGIKFRPIEKLSDSEIDVLERVEAD